MKRLITLLLAAALCSALVLPTLAEDPANAQAPGDAAFADVSPNAWYAGAVEYVAAAGIMTGTGDNAFTPLGIITHREVAVILHRLSGSPAASPMEGLPDWCSQAVGWAVQAGIADGSDVFAPVSREGFALLLWRFAGCPEAEAGEDFADEDSISAGAAQAVDWARSRGIMVGKGGNLFAPQDVTTRAEAAMIVMNYERTSNAIGDMCAPSGIVAMPDGRLLVSDTCNKVLWRLDTASSQVYAGGMTVLDMYGAPVGGYNDAGLADSYFGEPWAVAPFLDGWAVSDAANNVVRLVRTDTVETVNGSTRENLTVTDVGVAFSRPTGLAADDAGNLYVSDTLNGAIRRITAKGTVTTVASGLNDPTGLCWKDGVLYICETGANRIVKLERGSLTTVAGSGEDDFADGPAGEAMFSNPQGVAVGDDGTIYVSDTTNSAVRCIRDGQVSTLVRREWGSLELYPVSPMGLLVQDGQLVVCDNFSRKLLLLPLTETP